MNHSEFLIVFLFFPENICTKRKTWLGFEVSIVLSTKIYIKESLVGS